MHGNKHVMVVIFCAAFFATFLQSATQAQIDFDAPRAAFVGSETRQFEVGDFDEDGLPDLVCVGTGEIKLVLSRDGLRFRSPRTIESEATWAEIEIGDLDEDSHLDVVIESNERLIVRFGDGNGRFPRRTEYAVDGVKEWWWSDALRLADVDGDTHLDIVRIADSTLSFFRGDGRGGLGDPVPTPVSPGAWAFDSADFNRDGYLDFVMSTHRGHAVWLGSRSGTFHEGDSLGEPSIDDIVTGDWDGDGLPDIATRRHDRVEVWLGDGQGGFPTRLEIDRGPLEWIQGMASVPTAETNRETLLFVFGEGNSVMTLVRYEVTEARQLRRIEEVPLPAGLLWLQSADLEGDGDVDWLACGVTHFVTLFHREAGHPVHDPSTRIRSDSPLGLEVAAFDYDHDGDLDILTNAHRTFRNDGTDGYVETDFLRDAVPAGIEQLMTGDFTSDGLADLLVRTSSDTLEVIPADTSAGATKVRRSRLNGRISPAFSADIDADGLLDVVGTSRDGRGWMVFGQGDGTFGERKPLQVDSWARLAADFDGDGADDVLSNTRDGNRFHMTAGDPSRRFERKRFFHLGATHWTGYDAGDLTGDGITDLVLHDRDNREIRVALSAEGRGLRRIRTIGRDVPGQSVGIHLHDFDADGNLDLAVSIRDCGSTGMLIRRGLGGGRFDNTEAWFMERFWFRDDNAVFADVDQDGDDDVIQLSWGGLVITKNRSRQPGAPTR